MEEQFLEPLQPDRQLDPLLFPLFLFFILVSRQVSRRRELNHLYVWLFYLRVHVLYDTSRAMAHTRGRDGIYLDWPSGVGRY